MPRGKSRKKWVSRNREPFEREIIQVPPEVFARVEQWLINGMESGFTGESGPSPVDEDPDEQEWLNAATLRKSLNISNEDAESIRLSCRLLAQKQPNVIQALRLYVTYVFGREFSLTLEPRDPGHVADEEEEKTAQAAEDAITEFLQANWKHWRPVEFGHRTWRDGEQFTRKVSSEWPPKLVFIDPEEFGDPVDSGSDTKGIVTDPNDVTTVRKYLWIDPVSRRLRQEFTPDEIIHTKIDVDSNVKRGLSRFYAAAWFAQKHGPWLATELQHRKTQASIVLQRKVKGSPNQVNRNLDNLSSGVATVGGKPRRQETIRANSIITTNQSTELQFCQPDTNFADSSPIGRELKMQIAAATGWPYYAISADSSESNLASQLVQESPVVLMVENEQQFFANELRPIFEWVLECACEADEIPGYKSLEALLEKFRLVFRFCNLVTRDGLKYAQETNLGLMNESLSPQEGSRRYRQNPRKMQAERKQWVEQQIEAGMVPMGGGPGNIGKMNQNPQQQAKNASAGTGTNQGDGGPIQHDDKVT